MSVGVEAGGGVSPTMPRRVPSATLWRPRHTQAAVAIVAECGRSATVVGTWIDASRSQVAMRPGRGCHAPGAWVVGMGIDANGSQRECYSITFAGGGEVTLSRRACRAARSAQQAQSSAWPISCSVSPYVLSRPWAWEYGREGFSFGITTEPIMGAWSRRMRRCVEIVR